MPAQVNQLAVKEQAQQVAQQMLPQMHATISAQQTPTLGPTCYPNQSFNVQNPQFTKNFMTNRPSPANISHYQIQGQFNNNGQSAPGMPQTINGMHHAINQSRPLHQRMPQSVSHSPAQLLQQNMRLGSPAQQSVMPQSMNLQANNMGGLQTSMSMEQQNHAIGLQQQQSLMQSNPRPNGMHNQLSMNGSSIANMSGIMSALYEKDHPQQTLATLTNSQSPTSASNFQLNFNQGNFNQNQAFGQSLSQNQSSPSCLQMPSVSHIHEDNVRVFYSIIISIKYNEAKERP
jgi:protein SMG7